MTQQTCPVCGQPVDESCPSVVYQGRTYYLRCGHCVLLFRANPEHYLQQPGSSHCGGEHKH